MECGVTHNAVRTSKAPHCTARQLQAFLLRFRCCSITLQDASLAIRPAHCTTAVLKSLLLEARTRTRLKSSRRDLCFAASLRKHTPII